MELDKSIGKETFNKPFIVMVLPEFITSNFELFNQRSWLHIVTIPTLIANAITGTYPSFIRKGEHPNNITATKFTDTI